MNIPRRALSASLAAALLLPSGPAQAALVYAPYRATAPKITTAILPLRLAAYGSGARSFGTYRSDLSLMRPVLPSADAQAFALSKGWSLQLSPVTSPVSAGANAARLSADSLLRSLPFASVKDQATTGVLSVQKSFGLAKAKAPAGGAVRLSAPSHDFARMFDIARRILVRPAARKFLREIFKDELVITDEMRKDFDLPDDMDKIKEVSVSQLMLLLQHNADQFDLLEKYLAEMEKADETGKDLEAKSAEWRAVFREMIKDEKLSGAFKKLNDPENPMRLENADGSAGYRNQKLYATHQSVVDGKTVPPSDLRKVVIDFIASAKKEIMLNVFDFDLMEVADALIAKAESGVKVTVGIDWKNSALKRPEVQAVVQRLTGLDDKALKKALENGGLIEHRENLAVRLVDSVGLNHQKMIVVDWNDKENAKALFSSGNLTQSCIGPEGDLKDAKDRPDYSIPNANHLITLDSYLLAQVAADNMTKTLIYGLKGNEYPLGGAFKVFGETPAGAKEAPYAVLTFSPKGGLGDINRDIIRRMILETRGPLRFMQFAFSAVSIVEAVIERAKREVAEGLKFDFKAVFDTSFALRDWSGGMALDGYEVDAKTQDYVESKDNSLRAALGDAAYEKLLADVRVAPAAYRTHMYKTLEGAAREVNAKLHHKVIISGLFAILGTSFNVSENANHNQEQLLLTNDAVLVAAINAAFDGLFAISPKTLVEAMTGRNEWRKTGAPGDDYYKADDQYEHVADQASHKLAKK